MKGLSLSNEGVAHAETAPVFSYQIHCGSINRGTALLSKQKADKFKVYVKIFGFVSVLNFRRSCVLSI